MGETQKMDTMLESLSNGVSVHWVISSHFPANMQVRLDCSLLLEDLNTFIWKSCRQLPSVIGKGQFLISYQMISCMSSNGNGHDKVYQSQILRLYTEKLLLPLQKLYLSTSFHWLLTSHWSFIIYDVGYRFGQTLQCWMRMSSLGMFTHLSEKLLSLVCADLPMKGLILEFFTPYPLPF